MLASSLALSDSKGTSHTVVPLARQPGIEESKTGGVESGDESAKGSISYSNSGVSPLLSAVRTDSSEALITISRFSTAQNNVPWPTPPNFPSRSALKRPQPPTRTTSAKANMDSRLAQPRNTRESRVHASFKKVTVRSAPHEWKGSSLSQRVDDALPLPRKRIASNDEQYAKALPSIPLTLSGTTSDSSEEHPSNALSLIYLSPSVRVRDRNAEQP